MVDSKLLPYAVDASNVIAAIAPSQIKDAFRTSLRDLRQIWDQEVQQSREKLESVKAASRKKKEK
jgi:hypothetical protein